MSLFSTYPAAPLQLDASGNLLVNVNAGGASGGTSATVGAAYPATATAAGAKDNSGNLAALNLDASGFLKVNVAAGSGSGFSAADGTAFTAGTTAAVPASAVYNDSVAALTSGNEGTLRSTANRGLHANLRNAAGTEIGTLSNAVRIDPTGTTTQPVSGTFWQSTQPVSGTFWQSTQPVSLAATITSTQTPATSGGLSFYSGTIGATVTAVKASAGQLYGYDLYNANTSAVYIQIFNKLTGSVTLGTTAPDMVIVLPASGGRNVSYDSGIALGTGLCFAVTTTRTGSTAPASTVDVNFFYK